MRASSAVNHMSPGMMSATPIAAEGGGDEEEIPVRYFLPDLDVGDAAGQDERDDGLADGVEIHEGEGARDEKRAHAHSHFVDEASAPDVACPKRGIPERVCVLLACPAPEREDERRGDQRADDDSSRRHVRRSRPVRAATTPSAPESRRGARASVPRSG